MREYLHIILATGLVALVVGWTAGYTANSAERPMKGRIALSDLRE